MSDESLAWHYDAVFKSLADQFDIQTERRKQRAAKAVKEGVSDAEDTTDQFLDYAGFMRVGWTGYFHFW